MTPITVTILSTIQPLEAEEGEIIEQKLSGSFALRGDDWIIKYQEDPHTPEEVRTTVKAREKEVIVIRQGMVNYRQTYRPDEVTVSRIETPGGTSQTEVSTRTYERKGKDQGGTVQFAFSLKMGAEKMGFYQLSIEWTEVAPSC